MIFKNALPKTVYVPMTPQFPLLFATQTRTFIVRYFGSYDTMQYGMRGPKLTGPVYSENGSRQFLCNTLTLYPTARCHTP
jgi:hypothetical protein